MVSHQDKEGGGGECLIMHYLLINTINCSLQHFSSGFTFDIMGKPGWLGLRRPPACFSNVVLLGGIQAFWFNALEDASAFICQHPGSWVCG